MEKYIDLQFWINETIAYLIVTFEKHHLKFFITKNK